MNKVSLRWCRNLVNQIYWNCTHRHIYIRIIPNESHFYSHSYVCQSCIVRPLFLHSRRSFDFCCRSFFFFSFASFFFSLLLESVKKTKMNLFWKTIETIELHWNSYFFSISWWLLSRCDIDSSYSAWKLGTKKKKGTLFRDWKDDFTTKVPFFIRVLPGQLQRNGNQNKSNVGLSVSNKIAKLIKYFPELLQSLNIFVKFQIGFAFAFTLNQLLELILVNNNKKTHKFELILKMPDNREHRVSITWFFVAQKSSSKASRCALNRWFNGITCIQCIYLIDFSNALYLLMPNAIWQTWDIFDFDLVWHMPFSWVYEFWQMFTVFDKSHHLACKNRT